MWPSHPPCRNGVASLGKSPIRTQLPVFPASVTRQVAGKATACKDEPNSPESRDLFGSAQTPPPQTISFPLNAAPDP